jgi:uncharacterized protein DUF4926
MIVVDAPTTFDVCDYVEIPSRAIRGTVVDAYPDRGTYTVEVSDDDGRLIELVPVHGRDLRLLERPA